ncbi:hypothetical protein [Actinomadura rubrisoli]|uniref:Uncharacterized protein n=1 Tax=Actinomadura rubrisoli TaxID=2530368 RepID=A0A4R4ZVM5_9ACTN|nr:hypothetical protein [Actinomadura rubrisoli]TDD62264.1 hypothetical protein E1298_44775 [Actinomadura rubrisoli]
MSRLNRPKAPATLTEIGQDSRRLAHQILDGLPPSKTLDHLRSGPDGHRHPARAGLVKLERWAASLLTTRTAPAIWHPPATEKA